MLERRELGRDAVTFLRASLSRGGMALSRFLLNLPLEEGQVYAFLPDRMDQEAARKFELGGLLTEEATRGIERRVADLVASHLRQSDDAYAVFENPVMRPSDQSAIESPLSYFTSDQEIYYFLPPGETGTDTVIATLRGVHSWVFNGTLAFAKGLGTINNRQQLDRQVLEALAACSEHILVGAYDYEGYLIWSRR